MKINTQQKLISHIESGKNVSYTFFYGHTNNSDTLNYTCFSQWFMLPKQRSNEIEDKCQFLSHFPDNSFTLYTTTEHYMMAEKARLFNNCPIAILNAETPSIAKKLGRKVSNFDEVTWNDACYDIVVEGNYLKFSQNDDMKKVLLSTGDTVIVEASPWDNIWGIGLGMAHPDADNPKNWQGTNLLGFALMDVRERLRNE